MDKNFTAFTLSGAPHIAAVFWLWSGLVALILVVFGLIVALVRARTGRANVPSAEELRGRLAQAVTMWAMIAIALLGLGIIVIGGYNASIANTDIARREFIDTAKYVFAAVLPVVAAWVGTVMAFYFGRENFRLRLKA
jgi:heme/copper-type cytochrome/quinol oxidase subunit 2